uniref:Peptidase S8/S53 domain-containing protein n=1 Tax=Panagrolaimus davidi TaxID=227884 RepID=A0A914QMT4_9BILA
MFCFPFKNFIFKSASPRWQKSYIPKDLTQQDTFLSKYPSFDGRGIKIAIIDGGFDVSLEGLQRTSEGLPKIIDCFDFTGVGNVDTSVIREIEKNDNILIGLSGRKFKIPKHWKNPTGKWNLGLKSLFKPTMSNKESEICQKLSEIDCIVWFDGSKWCACIETTFGDLKKAKILTNFRDEHQYSILHLEKFKIPYCITIHNEGNLLEIFTGYCDHGSVVAQTAAAYFPENQESDNGLAPGAQIVLMNIWGPEKDSDEQFLQALNKALDYALDEKIVQLITNIVKEYNILIFKSAGNYGPFYATVLKRDRLVEDVIFRIGAAQTDEIKKRVYHIHSANSSPPAISDQSSRGPGAMGSQGLDFVAPGAVVIKGPRFPAEKYGAFTGTSIASANAAGAVACLLSALKANSIQYSTKSIKFVLTKTANLPKNQNKFEFGHGILQIYDAFNYYRNHSNIDFNNILPKHLPATGEIHFIKNDDAIDTVMEREICLSQFIETEPFKDVAKNWILEISPKTAESFIELLQTKTDENYKFKIKADTKNLEAGSLNFAEILVMDSILGSILNIPINVVYVLKVTETHNFQFKKEITLNFENPYHLIFWPCFEKSSSNKKCEIKITNTLENTALNLCIKYEIMNEIEETISVKTINFIPNVSTQMHSIPIENKCLYEFCIYQSIDSSFSFVTFNLEFNFMND